MGLVGEELPPGLERIWMPRFNYIAKAADGKPVRGSTTAATQMDAMVNLKRLGFTSVSLREESRRKGLQLIFGPPKPRVRSEDMAVFTRQLATMISAGIPLLEALEILEEQAEDPGFKLALGDIVDKVRGGSDFSESLSDFPKLFSRIYVSMVKAGEAAGALDTILVRLAEYMEATEELKREIKSAMTYPSISLALILIIATGLMVFIVPQFKRIFDSLGVPLPTPTKILLSVSGFMTKHIGYLAIGVVALLFVLRQYKRTKIGRRHFDWLFMHLPVFGPLVRKVSIARFARTFSTLLKSGVPILGALEIVAATSGNSLLEDAILSARESIRKGETLGEPLARTEVFPLMVTKMISIGERAGALEQLLEKIAEFYDQQVKATVKALTSLIEPILIGIMGAVVGSIVLAIFLPILSIQEAVRKK